MPLNVAKARSDLFSRKIPLGMVVKADRMEIQAMQATHEGGSERELGVQMARIPTGRVF